MPLSAIQSDNPLLGEGPFLLTRLPPKGCFMASETTALISAGRMLANGRLAQTLANPPGRITSLGSWSVFT
jgi:hypothetical protein